MSKRLDLIIIILQGLTDNQNRVLYLIYLHTKPIEKKEGNRKWIRKQAFSVLVYEGVVAKIFDYDYAPHSILIEKQRKWFNFSQEGQSDIELLREEELINALILPSSSYKPGVCYQISDKGRELITHVSRHEKGTVDDFAHREGTRELLKVVWDGDSYWLQSLSGYRQKSTITETEDVSYVSSAYIPQCLRYGGRPTMSNAHRAHSSGFGAIDNIRDNDLDEIITLNSVSTIVAEYVPFGANQIVQLNNNIGSNERVQGGFISPEIDINSSETTVELSSELTSVEILDYTLANHINFEAEIRFKEETGVIQVETFGISLNAEGTCFYGMQIEAVMNRIKDGISLDHLSRILVDVQQDSSKIVDSVISQYQKDILDLIFMGDTPNRNKVNLIIANEISPHLTAEEYMDKGEYENEFKQIIGDTKAAYDISESDTLVFGAHGLLLCGPRARSYEPLLCAYLQFLTLDIFLQNYFARIRILTDDIKKTDLIAETITFDPTALSKIRNRIWILSNEIIKMDEILGFILEALEIMEIPPEPQEQTGRSLFQRLEISGMKSQLLRRSNDVKKNVIAIRRNLVVLQEKVNAAAESRIVQLYEGLEQNTKNSCALQLFNVDTVHSLTILKIIFSGILAFDFLDRITGDWSVIDTVWMESFVETFLKENMLLWFLVSMVVWVLIAFTVSKLFFVMNWRTRGMTTVKIKVNKKINIEKVNLFLNRKIKSREERQYEGEKEIVKISYTEPKTKEWGGSPPAVTIEYDERNKFLLQIVIKYNRRGVKREDLVLTSEKLKEKILNDFHHQRVFDNVEGKNNVSLTGGKNLLHQ